MMKGKWTVMEESSRKEKMFSFRSLDRQLDELTASLKTSLPNFNSCNLLSVGSRIYCFSNSTIRVLNPSWILASVHQSRILRQKGGCGKMQQDTLGQERGGEGLRRKDGG